MSIINLNLVKRVSRMNSKDSLFVVVFHFDMESYNHKTICIPSDYLEPELKIAINEIKPGEDIEWNKFLREYKIHHLLND